MIGYFCWLERSRNGPLAALFAALGMAEAPREKFSRAPTAVSRAFSLPAILHILNRKVVPGSAEQQLFLFAPAQGQTIEMLEEPTDQVGRLTHFDDRGAAQLQSKTGCKRS